MTDKEIIIESKRYIDSSLKLNSFFENVNVSKKDYVNFINDTVWLEFCLKHKHYGDAESTLTKLIQKHKNNSTFMKMLGKILEDNYVKETDT